MCVLSWVMHSYFFLRLAPTWFMPIGRTSAQAMALTLPSLRPRQNTTRSCRWSVSNQLGWRLQCSFKFWAVFFITGTAGVPCFTDVSNWNERYCIGCGGGHGDCHEDVVWKSDTSQIGSTVCGFLTSWTVNSNEWRITIDSGGNARSRLRDSYQTSCMICMCDGTAPSGECPENPNKSEGTRHYYRQMNNNGMNYAQAQGTCTGQLSMARFDTQAEFNHIRQLVG